MKYIDKARPWSTKIFFLSTSFASAKRSTKKSRAVLRLLAEFKSPACRQGRLVYVGKLLAKARQTSQHLTSRLVKLGFDAYSQRHFLKPLDAMLVKRAKEQLPLNPASRARIKATTNFFPNPTSGSKASKKSSLPSGLQGNFQMFDPDLSGEFLKISSAKEIFSSENRSRSFRA